ncbi:Sphingosine N-acyltransferase lac1 [Neolecta irregularis DAH-3]|uniref:Sphingosine N-acyltransferase lac1 n=1 Tax=Neolecta irregularis (strain DAH-3) TaxID=1198029 RepID=A0A1U7LVB1_NEOID|nr:Sphingosine N-acyltransferase lac1 [Neolecta irregularis DAH-3]|eukprot:OLL26597.1 Sphingosine N-acyltransferase lac1 [Neolecta irregularis DAH-3]
MSRRLSMTIEQVSVDPAVPYTPIDDFPKRLQVKHGSLPKNLGIRPWQRYRSLARRKSWSINSRGENGTDPDAVPPLTALSIMFGLYLLNPTSHNPIHRALFVSYPVSNKGYSKGLHDITFVIFYIIVFSAFREFVMHEILKPLAKLNGLRNPAKVLRFMEQGYSLVYFSLSTAFGLYNMYGTDLWYFHTRAFFEEYPHKILPGAFKVYYLLQAAYWVQQIVILILQIERPRKDFKEFTLHHIVTCMLVIGSYMLHFTHMGLAVFITMDSSDVFLSLSKLLNYVKSRFLAPVFVVFVLEWIYARHYLSVRLLICTVTEFLSIGPNMLDWDAGLYKSWLSQSACFSLLLTLQLVNYYWLGLILRIAYRYAFKNIARDDRSEDEEKEE